MKRKKMVVENESDYGSEFENSGSDDGNGGEKKFVDPDVLAAEKIETLKSQLAT
jgi:hypothetical protein